MTDIGLFEAIHTARSLRRFRDEPVPDALITRVLDAAIRAPSGGNAQHWTFIVVRDAVLRQRLGAIYRKAAEEVGAIYAARPRPAHLTEAQYRSFLGSSAYLWEHMGEAPVILVPCLKRRDMPPPAALPPAVAARWDVHQAYQERIRGSSIYPAVQNIILACRGLGLGTVLTTIASLYEDELKQALDLPADIDTFALMPVGFPVNRHGPVTRRPVAEVTFADRWGQAWPD
jgi:nitroreductase